MNVVYVTIDSVRADHTGYIDAYSQGVSATPEIDALAEGGTACTQAYASGIPTYYSFKSLLGGTYALSPTREIGVGGVGSTLPEEFRDAGYSTAGFSAGNPWLTPGYGYSRGFDVYRDFLDGGVGVLNSVRRRLGGSEVLTDVLGRAARTYCAYRGRMPKEPAERVTGAATDWLVEAEEPFFLWVHLMDPHYPWPPSGGVSTWEAGRLWHQVSHHNREGEDGEPVSERDLRTIRELYEGEVRRSDRAVGRLVDVVRELGVYSDTVVAVAGDHGTELHDHGGFSHGPRSLYNEVLHVPFVVGGGGAPEARVDDPVSLLDVPATLLDLCGVHGSTDGRSIYGGAGEAVAAEVVYDVEPARGEGYDNGLLAACVDPPWKLIVNQDLGTEELYDLEEDPGEERSVAGQHPGVVRGLRGELEEYRSRVERRNRTVREKRRVRRRVRELEGV